MMMMIISFIIFIISAQVKSIEMQLQWHTHLYFSKVHKICPSEIYRNCTKKLPFLFKTFFSIRTRNSKCTVVFVTTLNFRILRIQYKVQTTMKVLARASKIFMYLCFIWKNIVVSEWSSLKISFVDLAL